MTMRLSGFAALTFFYALFLAVGALASWRGRHADSDEFLLAGRRLPLWIGVLTMTATWVGGGYINGTAEAVYDPQRGLLWAQAPWCYALSLILGGLLFARRMRRCGFTTMLDLFAARYGKRVAAGLYLPALVGDLFWSAAILAALGAAFGTVLGLDYRTAILISASVAIAYSVLGGLWSVAYTDALQLLCILVGLCVALPFVFQHTDGLWPTVEAYRRQLGDSAGLIPRPTAFAGDSPWGWSWVDMACLLVFGGIPWQVYFQRVLACRSDRDARRLSVLAGACCLLMAIPAVMIGMAGALLDWDPVAGAPPPTPALILPYVLRYWTPPAIATIGLGAVAAAVMSSVDSSILSSSTMFTWNIYRPLLRPRADGGEIRMVTRVAIVAIGSAAAVLALRVASVYTLWYLCADLVYVVLFPQLVMGLLMPRANAIGAISGAAVGLLLRLGGGEPQLGIPAWLPYPGLEATGGTLFPFRTFAMLVSLATIAVVSVATRRWNAPRPLELPHVEPSP